MKRYTLIRITPEEYITLGDAGVWVVSTKEEALESLVAIEKPECEYPAWQSSKTYWAKQAIRHYTRIEEE